MLLNIFFLFFNNIFQDIDECSIPDLSECMYRCENNDGSFSCACPQGYTSHQYGKTCQGTLWTSFNFGLELDRIVVHTHTHDSQLRWPSGKSVRLGSCRLGFDSESGQTNDFLNWYSLLPCGTFIIKGTV